MTTKFYQAMTTKDILTENGMPTHSTSGMSLVDMFFKMGGSRNLSESALVEMFVKALGESKSHALKMIFYNRDIREGQGERKSFRIFWKYLCHNYPDIARNNIENVPFFGRWDDLLESLKSPIGKEVADYILFALKSGDKLCAKWMPRENKSLKKFALLLMNFWEMSPKDYRQLLAGNTQVVENLMCENKWGEIKYEQVPSIAIKKYRKAWYRHDEERYQNWLNSLEKGESKINAGAIFPHDIVKPLLTYSTEKNEKVQLQEQWKRLPDYVGELDFIPVCDVSGSMSGLPMEVCISLGLYLSERNKSRFKNHVITFSQSPKLILLKGLTLYDRIMELVRINWVMNTNLEAVFKLILFQAREWNLPQTEMPEYLIIMSDMQFDSCVTNYSDTAFEMISSVYSEAGYEMPRIIFWNLRTSSGVPVKFDQKGTALVSGFSPSVMMSLLSGEMNPLRIMFNTLNKERYERVKV